MNLYELVYYLILNKNMGSSISKVENVPAENPCSTELSKKEKIIVPLKLYCQWETLHNSMENQQKYWQFSGLVIL